MERRRAVKSIFKGIKMKTMKTMKTRKTMRINETIEKIKKRNWIIELEAQKSIVGTIKYAIYVFDRTLRQFALIKKFDSLQEAKDYFNNLIKK